MFVMTTVQIANVDYKLLTTCLPETVYISTYFLLLYNFTLKLYGVVSWTGISKIFIFKVFFVNTFGQFHKNVKKSK